MSKLQMKEEMTAVAALLALGTLAIMTSMIASYALMKPAVQHYNVGTQVSVGYCGYKSGWFSDGGKFADCMVNLWIPNIPTGIGAAVGAGPPCGDRQGSGRESSYKCRRPHC